MNTFEAIIPLAPWLLAALWRATLVAGLATLLWLVIRKRAAALRAALLLAGVVGVLAVPLLASVAPVVITLPEWKSAAAAEPELVPIAASDAPVLPEAPRRNTTILIGEDGSSPVVEPSAPPPPFPAATVNETAPPINRETSAGRMSAGVALLLLWLAGTAVHLLVALSRLGSLYALLRRSKPVSADAENGLPMLLEQLGLPETTQVRESDVLEGPLALGLWQPAVLLPTGWREWSQRRREMVLAHELAHVRRRDFLAGLLAELAVCVFWFHPLVRWLAARLRLEQEFAADAWVVALGINAHQYVCCLAKLALEMDSGSRALAPALWRRRPEILRRIHMLRHEEGRVATTTRTAAWAAGLVAAAGFALIAGIGPAAGGNEPAEPVKVLKDLHGDDLPAGAIARGGSARFRHGSTAIAYSADGKYLASGGSDNQIRLFDAETGKELRRFAGHGPRTLKVEDDGKSAYGPLLSVVGDGFVCSVAFSPDGKLLASGGWDDCIRLWDVQTGKEVRKIDAHRSMVTRVAFAPDGRYLASRGGIDGTLKLWDPMTGTQLQKFTGISKINPWRFNHDAALAISPDSKTVATTARKAIVLYDAATGAEVKRWDGHVYGITLAYSGDGKMLASGGVDEGKDVYSLRLWDPNTGKEIRRCTLPKNEPPTYLQFAPKRDDRLAAVVAEDDMHIFDTTTGKEAVGIKHYWPSRLAYSPDGKSLTSAGSGPIIRHWDPETGKEKFAEHVGHRAGVSSVSLSQDGKWVASAGENVRLWERATGKPGKTIAVKGGAAAVAFSPDGKVVASAGRDRLVHLWNAETGDSIRELKGHKNPLVAVAYSPDGKLIASGDVQSTVRIWKAETGEQLHEIDNKSGTEALQLAFAPDSRSLAAAGAWNDASFIPKPGTKIKFNGKEIEVKGGFNIQGVEMTHREGYFVLVWNVETGKEVHKLAGLKDKIRSLAYSPDGKLLAATSRDGRVGVWEAASGKDRLFFLAHPGSTGASVAFAADSQTLITAAGDYTLRLWNVASGQELKQFRTPGAVTMLTAGNDGKTVVTGSSDGTVLMWDTTLPPPPPARGSHTITLQ